MHGEVHNPFAFLCVNTVYLPFCASGIKLCTPGCPAVLSWLGYISQCKASVCKFTCYCFLTRTKQTRIFPTICSNSMRYSYVQSQKHRVTGRSNGQHQDQYSRWRHGMFSGQQSLYHASHVFYSCT